MKKENWIKSKTGSKHKRNQNCTYMAACASLFLQAIL